MDAAAVELMKDWPWDRLAETVYARQEAARFAECVLEDRAATLRDRQVAALELEGAIASEGAARDELAAVFLLMLQCAIDKRPEALFGKMQAAANEVMWKDVVAWLVNSKPGGAEQWLAMSRRVAAAEECVETLRKENWELANWIARLEREMASHTGGAAHGNRSEGQGEAGGAGAGDGGERQAG